jgi:hypothetical protein
VAGSAQPTLAVGPARSSGFDGVRPHLEERLELSHGLVAAPSEPLTLRLGRLGGDPDLNPPQPPDPSGTRPP